MNLDTEIKFLPGVGPKRAMILAKEAGIFSFRDLLYYFPYRHIDRSQYFRIRDIESEANFIQIKGKIVSLQVVGPPRKQRLSALFSDGESTVELIWFRSVKQLSELLKPGIEYVVFGKPSLFKGKYNFAHPEMEAFVPEKSIVDMKLQPLYPTTEKMKDEYLTSKAIQKLIKVLLELIHSSILDPLPATIRQETHLMTLNEALLYIHFPPNSADLEKAIFRLKFDELFFLQLFQGWKKNLRNREVFGFPFPRIGKYFHQFYDEKLPFQLTNAQKRVIKEIRIDLGSGRQMNRLLQGDVGSGKTMVALLSMLIAIDNGYQAVMMAPTEILAKQHFNSISKLLDGIDIQVSLLTGSTKKAARTKIHEDLLDGSLNILVGTHALLEDTVVFSNLGIAVIDEQHRFGVAQRAKLWSKNHTIPHILVMTATPIPRTLYMTIYGDLDVSVIDELPPGRKPIQTKHIFDNKRLAVFGFIRRQIAEGRQVYIVYPLIKESEKLDFKALEEGYDAIVDAFPPPDYQVSIVHGKMKPADKDIEMQRFIKGETHIMVATTVIEVGVDVPNASVMIIESAERFGLSQLHQLRGRVGRGADQSFCILMSDFKLSAESQKRLEIMTETSDGFVIAEEDLKLRGPGDIEGTQQSGIAANLKLTKLGKDSQIIRYSHSIASGILTEDPDLHTDKYRSLVRYISIRFDGGKDWGTIS